MINGIYSFLEYDIVKVVTFFLGLLSDFSVFNLVPNEKALTEKLAPILALYKINSKSTQTIVGLLAVNKSGQTATALVILGALLSTYLIGFAILHYPLNFMLLAVTVGLMAMLFIRHKALLFRIRTGLYGTTDYEVRGIIQFIISQSQKRDGSGGSGLSQLEIFPAIDNTVDDAGKAWMPVPGKAQELLKLLQRFLAALKLEKPNRVCFVAR